MTARLRSPLRFQIEPYDVTPVGELGEVFPLFHLTEQDEWREGIEEYIDGELRQWRMQVHFDIPKSVVGFNTHDDPVAFDRGKVEWIKWPSRADGWKMWTRDYFDAVRDYLRKLRVRAKAEHMIRNGEARSLKRKG